MVVLVGVWEKKLHNGKTISTYFVCRFPQNAAAEYRDIWWFNNAGSPKTATVQIEPIISDYVVKDH